MATRNRTILFLQYRNSLSRTSSRIKTSQTSWDGIERASLIDHAAQESKDHIIELSLLPPRWTDVVNEVNDIMDIIKKEIKKLDAKHKAHLLPSFSDKTKEESEIEHLTSTITTWFHECQRLIHKIQREKNVQEESQGAQLTKNVQASLAMKLQDLSKDFRKMQSNYYQRIRGRDSKGKGYVLEDLETVDLLGDSSRHGFTEQQFQFLEDNERAISERNKEIEEIAKSIYQLADIFRDLQSLVIDQGSLLDRIDYNIEKVHEHTESAVVELTKADEYQKSSNKKCIVLLLILIALFVVLLVIKLSLRNSSL